MISKEQIREITRQANIVDIVGGYVSLKATGSNHLGLCPFHNEKTPSFTVSPARNKYHCFGCGADGDAVSFLMNIENLSFLDAVRQLADRLGVRLDTSQNNSGKKTASDAQQERVFAALEDALKFYRENLRNLSAQHGVTQYLSKRLGLPQSQETFEFGWAPAGWDKLKRYLLQLGYSEEHLVEAGLIRLNAEKKSSYDFFRERLIIPIRDHLNRCVGFAGRTLTDDGAKYINSPETRYYKKSALFYGFTLAKRAITRKKRAIVVEGYFDVLKMYEVGFTETISACGTALTSSHLGAIKRFSIPQIILLFDGDAAGAMAARKAARLCLSSTVEVRVGVLPADTDPFDFFARRTVEDMDRLLAESLAVDDFLIANAQQETAHKGINAESAALKELLDFEAEIAEGLKKELWRKKIAQRFGVSEKLLARAAQATPQSSLAHHSPAADAQAVGDKLINSSSNRSLLQNEERLFPQEFELLRKLLFYPQHMRLITENIGSELLESETARSIVERLKALSEDEFLVILHSDLAEIFPETAHLVHYLFETVPNRYKYNPKSDSDQTRQEVEDFIFSFLQNALCASKHAASPADQRALALKRREMREKIAHFQHKSLVHDQHLIEKA